MKNNKTNKIAGAVQDLLRKHNVSIKHSLALEIAALSSGFKDYHQAHKEETKSDFVFSTDDNLPVLTKNTVRVRWVNLDEGRNSDFDEDDKSDVNYLRFDVLVLEDSAWTDVCSYCTLMRSETSNEVLQDALSLLMTLVYEDVINGKSVESICEEYSNVKASLFTSFEKGAINHLIAFHEKEVDKNPFDLFQKVLLFMAKKEVSVPKKSVEKVDLKLSHTYEHIMEETPYVHGTLLELHPHGEKLSFEDLLSLLLKVFSPMELMSKVNPAGSFARFTYDEDGGSSSGSHGLTKTVLIPWLIVDCVADEADAFKWFTRLDPKTIVSFDEVNRFTSSGTPFKSSRKLS